MKLAHFEFSARLDGFEKSVSLCVTAPVADGFSINTRNVALESLAAYALADCVVDYAESLDVGGEHPYGPSSDVLNALIELPEVSAALSEADDTPENDVHGTFESLLDTGVLEISCQAFVVGKSSTSADYDIVATLSSETLRAFVG